MIDAVKIEGAPFVRDTESMALVNTDYSARDEYYAKRRMMLNHKQELDSVRSEIDSIKKDMTQIKDLLVKILEKG
jgi:hypothetical protein